MGVLRLVGEGLEKPEVIKQLLDLEHYKERPGYQLAPPEGLILYDCKYDNLKFEIPSESNSEFLERLLVDLYERQMLKLKLIGSIAQSFKANILNDNKFMLKRIKKKKTKRRKTIKESYENHMRGMKDMIKPNGEKFTGRKEPFSNKKGSSLK